MFWDEPLFYTQAVVEILATCRSDTNFGKPDASL